MVLLAPALAGCPQALQRLGMHRRPLRAWESTQVSGPEPSSLVALLPGLSKTWGDGLPPTLAPTQPLHPSWSRGQALRPCRQQPFPCARAGESGAASGKVRGSFRDTVTQDQPRPQHQRVHPEGWSLPPACCCPAWRSTAMQIGLGPKLAPLSAAVTSRGLSPPSLPLAWAVTAGPWGPGLPGSSPAW